MPSATNGQIPSTAGLSANDNIRRFAAPSRPLSPRAEHTLFHDKTRCFVYGLQPRAVQGMLDFDFICKRKTPSVAGIIYTFGGQFVSKMYWGTSETLLPVYQDVNKAMAKHSDVDTIVNFASSRSVYSSSIELNNIIANTTDGVYEGVAIGGDRYPSTTFIDHLLRYQADPECKILLLLGEVGGVEEYRVIEAVKDGIISK